MMMTLFSHLSDEALSFLGLCLLLLLLAVGSILWRKKPVRSLSLAAVPTLLTGSLYLTLLHDLNLPHSDGIPITAVMRLFGAESATAVTEARAKELALTMLCVAVVFLAVMLFVTWQTRMRKRNLVEG